LSSAINTIFANEYCSKKIKLIVRLPVKSKFRIISYSTRARDDLFFLKTEDLHIDKYVQASMFNSHAYDSLAPN
jgi:hypothetical protein